MERNLSDRLQKLTLDLSFNELFSLTALGIFSLGLQILFIRSLLDIFLGNELTLGLFLAIWLMGSAVGSYSFSRLTERSKLWNILVLLVYPIVILLYLLIPSLPEIFNLTPGAAYHSWIIIAAFLVTVFPVSLLCGALFIYFSRKVLSGKTRYASINTVYIWESMGALIIAFLLNFLFFHWLHDFQSMLLILMIFYLAILWLKVRTVHHFFFPAAAGFYVLLSTIMIPNVHKLENKMYRNLYSPYELMAEESTPYGRVRIMQLDEQTVVYHQGIVTYSLPDPIAAENQILLPVLAAPRRKNILILGGNLAAYLDYLGKISGIRTVTYVEKDPFLFRFQEAHSGVFTSSLDFDLRFRQQDAISFLSGSSESFELICMNKPEAITLDLNRYYTREFFSLIENHLADNGIFFFLVKSSENYVNPPLCRYLRLLDATLKSVFTSTVILPGDRAAFLVGNSPEIMQNLNAWEERLRIFNDQPRLLSPVYMKYLTSAGKMTGFREQLENCGNEQVNTDFNLKGYLAHFQLWSASVQPGLVMLNDFLTSHLPAVAGIILLFFSAILIFIRRRPRLHLLFQLMMVGALSISIEILILLEYQVIYGTIYSHLAILFGLFMAGLAAGAYVHLVFSYHYTTVFRLLYSALAIILLTLLFPVLFWGGWYYQYVLIPVQIAGTGFISGKFFREVTGWVYARFPESLQGLTYSMDLVGGMIAALLTSLFIIPLAGFLWAVFFLFLAMVLLAVMQ